MGNASHVAPNWFATFPAICYWASSFVENLLLCVLAFVQFFSAAVAP